MTEKVLPRQYLEETAYFMDFELKVTPDTFIPRPETELLVERVSELARGIYKAGEAGKLNILDLGTGSGNIAISLTKYVNSSKITALDVSGRALSVARENAVTYGCSDSIEFIESDLFGGLSGRHEHFFDIIVSNPPYISSDDMYDLPDEVKAEPRRALYGGEDGLSFYRAIVGAAPRYLKKNGFLAMELGYGQASRVRGLMAAAGFGGIRVYPDFNGIERIIIGNING